MPSAAPTWRTVVFVPLATPAFSRSTSDRITLVSCELAKPDADAEEHRAGEEREQRRVRRDHQRDDDQADRLEHEADAHDTRRADDARAARAPIGAPNAMSTPIGTMYTPVRERGEVLPVLEQHGDDEQEPELAHREHHRRLQAVAEARVLELAELEQRIAVAALLRALEHGRTPRGSSRRARSRRVRSRPAAVAGHNGRPATEKSCSGRNMP